MRSLTGGMPDGGGAEVAEGETGRVTDSREGYERNLARLKRLHHSNCLFGREAPCIPDIAVSFDDKGILRGTFTGTEQHQGYDDRMHGGLIAAIIDASMAQCLMGNGVAGYTADLKIKYRQPLLIGTPATLATRIVGVNVGILYSMSCEIVQYRKPAVEATARFYKFA